MPRAALLLFVLSGCDGSPPTLDDRALPVEALPTAGHAGDLTVGSAFAPGRRVQIAVQGGPPHGTAVLFSTTHGFGRGPCTAAGWPCLYLSDPRVVGTLALDAHGAAVVTPVVPAGLFHQLGDQVLLQAVTLGPGIDPDVTNVSVMTWSDSDGDGLNDDADACVGPTPDADGDGVCDDVDPCVGTGVQCGCPDVQGSALYLYAVQGTSYRGAPDVGGRPGANQLARTALPGQLPELGTFQAVAFLGMTQDPLVDLPGNHCVPASLPVYGVDGRGQTTLLASDWADLMDGEIDTPLAAALGQTDLDGFWTGSNPDGTASGLDCDGWTRRVGDGGTSSRAQAADGWLADATTARCSAGQAFLGLAWCEGECVAR